MYYVIQCDRKNTPWLQPGIASLSVVGFIQNWCNFKEKLKNLVPTLKTLDVCSTCHTADIKAIFPLMPNMHQWIRWWQ